MTAASALGRRLQPLPNPRCNGAIASTHLQTTLLHAEVHFELFDASAKQSLWEPRPLLGDVRPGAVRVRCQAPSCRQCAEDLDGLRTSYSGLHLEPLVRAIRTHNGRRPVAPLASSRIALMVLPDYENLFHQFGSMAVAWGALQESLDIQPPHSNHSSSAVGAVADVALFMLSNASLAPTRMFWSPGFMRMAPTFVRTQYLPPPPAMFDRVILVQPATETWWWNVWKPDATDRRAVLNPMASRLIASLLPARSAEARAAEAAAMSAVAIATGGVHDANGRRRWSSAIDDTGSRWALIINRPLPADRRILNPAELARGLTPVLAAHGLEPVVIDLAALDTRAQLSLVRHAGLLIGAHGAGLLWNLFLPPAAPVVELLNLANANEYYANHCRWSGRPYGRWQNRDPLREEIALDSATKVPLAPFRSHVWVNVSEVASVVSGVLSTSGTRTAASFSSSHKLIP